MSNKLFCEVPQIETSKDNKRRSHFMEELYFIIDVIVRQWKITYENDIAKALLRVDSLGFQWKIVYYSGSDKVPRNRNSNSL